MIFLSKQLVYIIMMIVTFLIEIPLRIDGKACLRAKHLKEGAPRGLKSSRLLHLIDLKWAPRLANFFQQHRCAVQLWRASEP